MPTTTQPSEFPVSEPDASGSYDVLLGGMDKKVTISVVKAVKDAFGLQLVAAKNVVDERLPLRFASRSKAEDFATFLNTFGAKVEVCVSDLTTDGVISVTPEEQISRIACRGCQQAGHVSRSRGREWQDKTRQGWLFGSRGYKVEVEYSCARCGYFWVEDTATTTPL